jgi:4-aminobutyrate aminotransferase-like enzyme
LRLAPPLTVEMSEIDEAVGVLSKVISEPTS